MAFACYDVPSGSFDPDTVSVIASGWADGAVTANVSGGAMASILIATGPWVVAFDNLKPGNSYVWSILQSGVPQCEGNFTIASKVMELGVVIQRPAPGTMVHRANFVPWGKTSAPLSTYTFQVGTSPPSPGAIVAGRDGSTTNNWVVQFTSLPGMGMGAMNGHLAITATAGDPASRDVNVVD
jgi:hypothetical protein